jgi:hypothetical protein
MLPQIHLVVSLIYAQKFKRRRLLTEASLISSGSSRATGVWPSAINSNSLVDILGSCGQVNAPADERLTAGDTGILDTSVPHLLVAAALVGETAQIFLRP